MITISSNNLFLFFAAGFLIGLLTGMVAGVYQKEINNRDRFVETFKKFQNE